MEADEDEQEDDDDEVDGSDEDDEDLDTSSTVLQSDPILLAPIVPAKHKRKKRSNSHASREFCILCNTAYLWDMIPVNSITRTHFSNYLFAFNPQHSTNEAVQNQTRTYRPNSRTRIFRTIRYSESANTCTNRLRSQPIKNHPRRLQHLVYHCSCSFRPACSPIRIGLQLLDQTSHERQKRFNCEDSMRAKGRTGMRVFFCPVVFGQTKSICPSQIMGGEDKENDGIKDDDQPKKTKKKSNVSICL